MTWFAGGMCFHGISMVYKSINMIREKRMNCWNEKIEWRATEGMGKTNRTFCDAVRGLNYKFFECNFQMKLNNACNSMYHVVCPLSINYLVIELDSVFFSFNQSKWTIWKVHLIGFFHNTANKLIYFIYLREKKRIVNSHLKFKQFHNLNKFILKMHGPSCFSFKLSSLVSIESVSKQSN